MPPIDAQFGRSTIHSRLFNSLGYTTIEILESTSACKSGTVARSHDPAWSVVNFNSCRSCDLKVPFIDGIPRFVQTQESYAANFGHQSNRYDVARPEEDEAAFEVKTGISARLLAERLILDAGCGGGCYARFLGDHKARVVGVDLSAAVTKAAALCARFPNVLILQADLLNLPSPESSFDLVYSIRVLHHTPDPAQHLSQARTPRQTRRTPGSLAVSP